MFIFRQYFSSGGSEGPNGKNLALLLHSYVQRTDLNLAREIAPNGKELLGTSRALKTPVLNMTGDHSPHVEATVAFNGRLQPNRCTWMKIQVCIFFFDRNQIIFLLPSQKCFMIFRQNYSLEQTLIYVFIQPISNTISFYVRKKSLYVFVEHARILFKNFLCFIIYLS